MTEIPQGCASFEDDLSALIDGELAPRRRAPLDVHLAGCTRCAERVAELREVGAILASLPASAMPADLRQRLEARVRVEASAPAGRRESGLPRRSAPPLRGRRRALSAVGGSLSLAAALLLAVYLGAGGGPALQPAQLALSDEALATALELDALDDLEVIANLELLERYLERESG